MVKDETKYTIRRTKEDIDNINKVRKYLKSAHSNYKFTFDSEIYRKLPLMFLNAINRIELQKKLIHEMKAQIKLLNELQDSVNHVLEICKKELPKGDA